jgi:hypothetical protein
MATFVVGAALAEVARAESGSESAVTRRLPSGAYETVLGPEMVEARRSTMLTPDGEESQELLQPFDCLSSVLGSECKSGSLLPGGYLGQGRDPEGESGNFRLLLQFPRLTESTGYEEPRLIPVGSHVLAAKLNMEVQWDSTTDVPIPVGAYGLLRKPGPGVSWEDAETGVPWITPGGDVVEEGDVDPEFGGTNLEYNFVWEPQQLVQEWINGEVISPGRDNDGLELADLESPAEREDVLTAEEEHTDFEPRFRVTWEPDTTPPTEPEDFAAMFEEDQTTVSWNPATDPPFPDGYPGSGVASYSYRYKVGEATWTEWASTPTSEFTIAETSEGEHVSVEVYARDVAGNESSTAVEGLTATKPTLAIDETGEMAPGEEVSEEGLPMEPEPEEAEGDALFGPATPGGVRPDVEETYTEHACEPGDNPCGKYDASAAAAYARKWNLNGQTDKQVYERKDWDREWDYFGESGGDCTNFVSQALHAGGMQFMGALGDDNPNGTKEWEGLEDPFQEVEGAWWSYWFHYPLNTTRSYNFTPAFVRAEGLYKHLLEYKLAKKKQSSEPWEVGDVIFWDLKGASLETKHIDHAQIVTRVTYGEIRVAQHTKQYERSLARIIREERGYGNEVGEQINYVVLHPDHAAANMTW